MQSCKEYFSVEWFDQAVALENPEFQPYLTNSNPTKPPPFTVLLAQSSRTDRGQVDRRVYQGF